MKISTEIKTADRLAVLGKENARLKNSCDMFAGFLKEKGLRDEFAEYVLSSVYGTDHPFFQELYPAGAAA